MAKFEITLAGLMVTALTRSQTVQCSWARHLTLTVLHPPGV